MHGSRNKIKWRKSNSTTIIITKTLVLLLCKKKNVSYLENLINYLKGDYYAGLDVGFNYNMLQKLRNYTEYTTTYSDPDIGSSCTAYSVYNAMRGAVKYVFDKESLKVYLLQ